MVLYERVRQVPSFRQDLDDSGLGRNGYAVVDRYNF